jgi:hypothetical protein
MHAMRAIMALAALWSAAAAAQPLQFDQGVTPDDRRLVINQFGYRKAVTEGRKADGKEPDVRIAKFDLNADGKPDFIVVVQREARCPGGCPTDEHLSAGTGYRKALSITADSISLGPASTRGVRDLMLNGRVRWVWNGSQYVIAE